MVARQKLLSHTRVHLSLQCKDADGVLLLSIRCSFKLICFKLDVI